MDTLWNHQYNHMYTIVPLVQKFPLVNLQSLFPNTKPIETFDIFSAFRILIIQNVYKQNMHIIFMKIIYMCVCMCLCVWITQSCPNLCWSKNTRVGWHSILQGIFPTLGSSPSLPHCRQILYCLTQQAVNMYLCLYKNGLPRWLSG